jgi:hypothetical protein
MLCGLFLDVNVTDYAGSTVRMAFAATAIREKKHDSGDRACTLSNELRRPEVL